MPISTTYTIKNTQGNLSFTINVGSASGPLELQQNADLTFYGYGRTGWGQEVDQNFYRLLENFAVQEVSALPKRPKTKTQLGGVLGINRPVLGQTWYNLTDSELYICSANATLGTETWRHILSDEFAVTKYLQINDASGTGPNAFIKLNGSNTPMTGFLELLHTPPSATWHAAPKGYVDDGIATLRAEADGRFIEKAGDTGVGNVTFQSGSSGPYTLISQGSIELGRIDGVSSSPFLDFHSSGGNIDYDTRIISTVGNGSVSGEGQLTLIGYAMVDRLPTLTNQITSKGYVDTAISNLYAQVTNSAAGLYVKKAGDTMTGSLNMNNNTITNLPSPTAGSHPTTKTYVDSNFYAPASVPGVTYGITISAAAPSGGNIGDIWFQL